MQDSCLHPPLPSFLRACLPGLMRSCLAVSWCITTFPRQGIACWVMACSSRKGNIQWTQPFLYLLDLCVHELMGQRGNSHYSSIHGLTVDVPHLNKYEDVLWARQDVSGKVCPSLFLPFPAHILPLQCNTGLFLRSWRPAENHNQKSHLLPMELFYLPAPQVAGSCYSNNCRSFNWCEA